MKLSLPSSRVERELGTGGMSGDEFHLSTSAWAASGERDSEKEWASGSALRSTPFSQPHCVPRDPPWPLLPGLGCMESLQADWPGLPASRPLSPLSRGVDGWSPLPRSLWGRKEAPRQASFGGVHMGGVSGCAEAGVHKSVSH